MISKCLKLNRTLPLLSSHRQLSDQQLKRQCSRTVLLSTPPEHKPNDRSNNQTSSPFYNDDFSFFMPENTDFSNYCSLKRCDKAVQTSFSSNSSRNTHAPPISLRWLVSFCDCLINMAKFYCMDSAQALQTFFSKGSLQLSSLEYNLFYGIFALFFILTFFSGYFVEKNGTRLSLFLFCLLVFLGHLLFLLGGTFESYGLMLIGRLVFGIGCTSVEVSQDLMIIEWFFDKELALAVGLSFASCRLGSALTILLTPKIMISYGLEGALFVGLLAASVGLGCSIVIAFVDRNYEDQKADLGEMESLLRDFSFVENGLTLQGLRDMGQIFWLFIVNAFLVYACYFAFTTNSNDILCNLYGFSPEKSGEMLAIMYASAACTPIFGYIIDRIGKRLKIITILLILLTIPFLLLGFLPVQTSVLTLLPSLVMIGLFFSSYAAALWSSFPLLIDCKQQCMAFATIYSTLNLALFVASCFIGVSSSESADRAHKYNAGFIFMLVCLILACLLVLRLNFATDMKLHALDSFVTNEEIRNIINEDPHIGLKLLDIMGQDNEINDSPSASHIEMRKLTAN